MRTTDSDAYVYTTYSPIYLDCRLDCTGFDPCMGEIFLSSPKFSDLLWHTRSTFSGGEGRGAAEDRPCSVRSVGRDGVIFYRNTSPPSVRVS